MILLPYVHSAALNHMALLLSKIFLDFYFFHPQAGTNVSFLKYFPLLESGKNSIKVVKIFPLHLRLSQKFTVYSLL